MSHIHFGVSSEYPCPIHVRRGYGDLLGMSVLHSLFVRACVCECMHASLSLSLSLSFIHNYGVPVHNYKRVCIIYFFLVPSGLESLKIMCFNLRSQLYLIEREERGIKILAARIKIHEVFSVCTCFVCCPYISNRII